MPKGKGTYGKQVGRPPKKIGEIKNKMFMGGPVRGDVGDLKPTILSENDFSRPVQTYDAGGRVKKIQGYTNDNASPQYMSGYQEGGLVKDLKTTAKFFADPIVKDVKKIAEYAKKKIAEKVGKRAKKRKAKNQKIIIDKKIKIKVPENVKKKFESTKGKEGIQASGKIRGKGKDATSVTLTGGGTYPTYKKGSKPAKSFKRAFATARKAGKKTFSWDGRKYTTEVK